MITLEIGKITLPIPQDLDLCNTYDNKEQTYRISIGIVDPTAEQEQLFLPVFKQLEYHRRGLFIENITFTDSQNNIGIKMELATINVYDKPFGTFYELESALSDTIVITLQKEVIIDTNRDKIATKDKKVKSKRKTTNKSVRK